MFTIKMSSPVDPVRRVARVRRAQRSQADAAETADSDDRRLPVPVKSPPPPAPGPSGEGPAAFSAQLLGQGGQKRGLKGGPETLDAAKAAYTRTEWSGPADRRARKGGMTRTEV